MKRGFIVFLVAVSMCCITGCGTEKTKVPVSETNDSAAKSLKDSSNQEYYMVTFASGIEYWKDCFNGFKQAASLHGSKTVYAGTNDLDVTKAVAVLEQVIAKNPAGIAVTCLNPDAYVDPINEAVEKGIPVVTFDSDSSRSNRYTYLGTGNANAGAKAASYMATLLNHQGKVAIITMPGNLTQEERCSGFKSYLEKYEKNIQIVQTGNGEADQTKSASVSAGIIQAIPDIAGFYATNAQSGVGIATAVEEAGKKGIIKIISFDTDKGTLDSIKGGTISGTVVQGTNQMGYWAFEMLYATRNNLISDSWKAQKTSPLPATVDTGVSIVTASNVDAFYKK